MMTQNINCQKLDKIANTRRKPMKYNALQKVPGIAFLALSLLVILQFLPLTSPKIAYADNPILSLPSGAYPYALAVNPNTNTIYVADYRLNVVSVINGSTNTVMATVSVGGDPSSVAVNPNTNTIYVANSSSNSVSVINGSTNTVTTTVSVGTDPLGIAVNPNTNTIYVANYGSNSVSVINGSTNTVTTTVSVGTDPLGIAVNPNTNTIYVANDVSNNVSVINGSTNTVTTTVSVGTGPLGIAVNPNTNTIYVANYFSNNVSVINGSTNTVTTTVSVGSYPYAIAVNPNTNTIYVANSNSNNVSVINGSTNTVTTTVSVGTGPLGIAVNPNTNTIYVANNGSNNVSVINGSTNTVTTTVSVGTNPIAIAVNPNTNTIYVANYNSNNVSVINGSTNYPTAPTNVSASLGNLSITLSWQPPLDNGGYPIGGYIVGLYPNNSQSPVFYSVPGTLQLQTINDLTPGISYNYSITATNQNGAGQPYLSTSPVTPIGPPNPPTNVTASSSNASATITWQAPTNTNGSPITDYIVIPSGGSPIDTKSTNTSYTVTGLTNGNTYVFSVIAVNNAGQSNPSNFSNAVTPASVPNPVSNLTAYSVGNDSVSLSWMSPTNTGGYPIEGYIISYANYDITIPATQNTYVVSNLSPGSSYSFSVVAFNQVGNSTPTTSSIVTVKSGYSFISLNPPQRVYDTRNNSGYQGENHTMGPGSINTISFAGIIPSSAKAVAINVTVTNTTKLSYLTLFPNGSPMPTVSTLNWVSGQTLANFAQIQLGVDQSINAYNFAGKADLIIDLVGYYTTGTPGSGLYNPITPIRVFDSRKLSPLNTSPQKIQVLGTGNIPSSGVSAVLVNLTGINPSSDTYLTLYPDGSALPKTSNLNLNAGTIRANMAIVPVGPDGAIDLVNAFGSINATLDIYGYFTDSSNPNATGSFFNPILPVRVIDTRPGSLLYGANTLLGPNQNFNLSLAGQAGIVSTSSITPTAISFNLTAVGETSVGYLTASPNSSQSTSNLNYDPTEPIPNQVVSMLNSNGALVITNGPGASTYFLVDITGWYW
jgi:YVTN family beta-propeller protein